MKIERIIEKTIDEKGRIHVTITQTGYPEITKGEAISFLGSFIGKLEKNK